MLTFPLMVLKLIPQLDMFVLRPKIETTRYNVVQIYAVVAVLPCRFHVYFVFWVLKKVHLKNVVVTYLLFLYTCFVFVLLVISKVS